MWDWLYVSGIFSWLGEIGNRARWGSCVARRRHAAMTKGHVSAGVMTAVCVCVCWDIWWQAGDAVPFSRFSRWHWLSVMNAKLIGLIEIHRQEESPLTSSAAAAACLEEINLITRSVRRRDRGLAPISILMNLCAWGISGRGVVTYYISSPFSCVLFVQLGKMTHWRYNGGKHTLHSGIQVSDICHVSIIL